MQNSSKTMAVSINPATGIEGEVFPFMDDREIEAALTASHRAYGVWRNMAITDRAKCFAAAAAIFRRRAEEFAIVITREMGKPIRQARAEIEKCAATCAWYAEYGPAMLEDEKTNIDGAYVSYLPMGSIFAVTPWNFPVWQIIRGAVPTMLAGNGVILKPAPNVVRSALNVSEVFLEAGLPASLLTIANVIHDSVPAIIADRRIAGVCLTGSVRAGAAVAGLAGRNVKKSLLELGGSDAFIVLADADLQAAAQTAALARFQNTGQVCVAAKRFIVEASIAAEFTDRLVDVVRSYKMGDPMAEDTFIGPMARGDLRNELDGQVARSVDLGARIVLGGQAWSESQGYYYQPTVLDNVISGMPAFDQETFGPVAAITVATDAEEAIALTNRSDFGLSASLWTRDLDRARWLARQIETGGVFINGFTATDPRTPVGGIKNSGYGRELSYFGVREFTNTQIVVCKPRVTGKQG